MTNDESNPNSEVQENKQPQIFELRSLFVIRHSSFDGSPTFQQHLASPQILLSVGTVRLPPINPIASWPDKLQALPLRICSMKTWLLARILPQSTRCAGRTRG